MARGTTLIPIDTTPRRRNRSALDEGRSSALMALKAQEDNESFSDPGNGGQPADASLRMERPTFTASDIGVSGMIFGKASRWLASTANFLGRSALRTRSRLRRYQHNNILFLLYVYRQPFVNGHRRLPPAYASISRGSRASSVSQPSLPSNSSCVSTSARNRAR